MLVQKSPPAFSLARLRKRNVTDWFSLFWKPYRRILLTTSVAHSSEKSPSYFRQKEPNSLFQVTKRNIKASRPSTTVHPVSLRTHILRLCKNVIHWMLGFVYLLNKGCSLLSYVMSVITNIIQVCTCYFPSTCCKTGTTTREMTGPKVELMHIPHTAFMSSWAAI